MIRNLKEGGFLAVLNIFSYSSFRGFPLVRPFQTKIEDPTSLNMLERNELSTIPEFLRFFFFATTYQETSRKRTLSTSNNITNGIKIILKLAACDIYKAKPALAVIRRLGAREEVDMHCSYCT